MTQPSPSDHEFGSNPSIELKPSPSDCEKDRWEEIIDIWKQTPWLSQWVYGGFGLLIGIGLTLGWIGVFGQPSMTPDLSGNLLVAVLETAVTVVFIDRLSQRASEQELKKRLKKSVGSRVNVHALTALEEMSSYGWLKDGSLRGANMTEANLRGAHFGYDTHFEMPPGEHDLRNACFRNADLTGAFLHHCDLRGADFRGADLQMANLADAKLAGADLRGANLLHANLTEAVLFEEVTIDEYGQTPKTCVRGAILDETTVLPNGKWAISNNPKTPYWLNLRSRSERLRLQILRLRKLLRNPSLSPEDRIKCEYLLAVVDNAHKTLLQEVGIYERLELFAIEEPPISPDRPVTYFTQDYLFLDALSRRRCQTIPTLQDMIEWTMPTFVDWRKVRIENRWQTQPVSKTGTTYNANHMAG